MNRRKFLARSALTASATVGATVLRKAVSGYVAISPNSLNSMAFSAGPLTVRRSRA